MSLFLVLAFHIAGVSDKSMSFFPGLKTHMDTKK